MAAIGSSTARCIDWVTSMPDFGRRSFAIICDTGNDPDDIFAHLNQVQMGGAVERVRWLYVGFLEDRLRCSREYPLD